MGEIIWETNYSNRSHIETQRIAALDDGFLLLKRNGDYDIQLVKTDELGLVTNIEDNEEIPENKIQVSNYPNPFNPTTTICYSLQDPGKVELCVFNSKGQKIRTLVNENISKGDHQIVWDGKDKSGNSVGSGIYFYKIKTGNEQIKTNKCLLLK
jgi:hypothetical protein